MSFLLGYKKLLVVINLMWLFLKVCEISNCSKWLVVDFLIVIDFDMLIIKGCW